MFCWWVRKASFDDVGDGVLDVPTTRTSGVKLIRNAECRMRNYEQTAQNYADNRKKYKIPFFDPDHRQRAKDSCA